MVAQGTNVIKLRLSNADNLNAIIIQDDDRRLSSRISSGVEFYHHGKKLNLLNWSLGGLGIKTFDHNLSAHFHKSTQLQLELRISTADGAVYPINTKAKCMHYNKTTGYGGLAFIDMSYEDASCLRNLLCLIKNSDAITIDKLVELPNADNNPQPQANNNVCQYTKLDNIADTQITKSRFNIIQGALLLGILALVAYNFYQSFLQTKSSVAFIMHDSHQVITPADGWLVPLTNISAGTTVTTGQKLFSIKNHKLDYDLERLASEKLQITTEITILEERKQISEKVLAQYPTVINSKLTSLEQQVKQGQIKLKILQDDQQRLSNAFKLGHATKTEVNDSRHKIAQQQAKIANHQALLIGVKSEIQTSDKFGYYQNSQVHMDTPAEINDKLILLKQRQQSIEQQYQLLLLQQQTNTIVSPCDCIIEIPMNQDGRTASVQGWHKSGSNIINLIADNDKTMHIIAKFPLANIDDVQLGKNVSVTTASSKVNATITKVEVLGDYLQTRISLAPKDIATMKDAKHGTPVTVVIDSFDDII